LRPKRQKRALELSGEWRVTFSLPTPKAASPSFGIIEY
jgi:hypothetical protein